MNRREKLILLSVAAAVVAFVIYLTVDSLLLGPSTDLDKQIVDVRAKLDAAATKNRMKVLYEKDLRQWASRALCGEVGQASSKVRERISTLLERAALTGGSWRIQPLQARSVRGQYAEIGWIVQADGELKSVVDFLYLLDAEPYLHRLDNLEITPVPRSARVRLDVRYVTLVLPASNKGAGDVAATGPADNPPATDLDGRPRRNYDVIVSRDLLRPYIKRPPPRPAEPPPEEPRQESPRDRRPRGASEDRFRVVALPTWGGQADVFVRDSETHATRRYQVGDSLAGGRIAMVDYRRMPLPDRPDILSGSRVVVQIEQDYWAVELGQSLAQKRRLKAEQLPPGTQPAAAASQPALPGGGRAETR